MILRYSFLLLSVAVLKINTRPETPSDVVNPWKPTEDTGKDWVFHRMMPYIPHPAYVKSPVRISSLNNAGVNGGIAWAKAGGLKPAGAPPAGAPSVGAPPAGEAPTGETPAGGAPAGEAPAGETLADEELAEEALAGDELAEEEPAGDELAEEALAGEALAGDEQAEDALAGEEPAGESPSEEEPAETPPGGTTAAEKTTGAGARTIIIGFVGGRKGGQVRNQAGTRYFYPRIYHGNVNNTSRVNKQQR